MATFNIKTLALDETTTLQLAHPGTNELLWADDAETLPVEAVIYGKTSGVFRSWFAKNQRDIARLAKAGKERTTEEQDKVDLEFLCKMTVSVSNMDLDGTPVDTPEMVKELYSTKGLEWISNQVWKALGNDSNFLSN